MTKHLKLSDLAVIVSRAEVTVMGDAGKPAPAAVYAIGNVERVVIHNAVVRHRNKALTLQESIDRAKVADLFMRPHVSGFCIDRAVRGEGINPADSRDTMLVALTKPEQSIVASALSRFYMETGL